MTMLRLFILCLLLVLSPGWSLATEPSTEEEFVKALTPPEPASSSDTAEPAAEKPEILHRSIGGTQQIAAKPSVAMHLTFALNSAELSDHSKAVLTSLGRALERKSLRGYVYQLAGHTCDRGTATHNLDLSRRRALSVQNYLTKNYNLHTQQFMVNWYGETQPMVPNADEAARRQNRRVVITNTLQTFDQPLATDEPVVLMVKCHRGDWEETLEDGDALTARDLYAVEFKTTTNLCVYIYQVDPAGQVTQLFPNPKFSTAANPVAAEAYQRLPEPGYWFYLDDNTGREQVILLAAESSLDDPGTLCARIATEQSEKTMLAMNGTPEVTTRSFKVVVQEDPADSVDSELSAPKAAESETVTQADPDVFIIRRFFMNQ